MSRRDAATVYLAYSGANSFIQSTMFTVLAVYFVQVVGMNPLQLVLVGTVLETSYFLFEAPTGVVADAYSRRLSIIIGQFLIGVCFVAQGLVPLFGAILLAEAVRGVGESFISGALPAWLADEVGEQEVGRLYLRGSQARLLAALVGTFGGVGLASVALNLPVFLGGLGLLGLSGALAVWMPERGFTPAPHAGQGPLSTLRGTLGAAVRAVRQSPLVPTILAIGVVFGGFSEGFDRLWEAHLLTNFTFPTLGALDSVVWFGLIRAGGILLKLGGTEVARRRVDVRDPRALARALLLANGLLVGAVVVFGLAGSFYLAIAAYWAASVLRTVQEPLYTTWLNHSLDSRVRATVLSLSGQADSLGQVAAGPAVGLLATVFSLRAALVTAGGLLSPALLLYARALRHGHTGEPRDKALPAVEG